MSSKNISPDPPGEGLFLTSSPCWQPQYSLPGRGFLSHFRGRFSASYSFAFFRRLLLRLQAAGGPTHHSIRDCAGCPILSTVSSWKGWAGMDFAHRPVAPASASGTWDSSTLRLNSCRDSDYRPHHRWLRRINLLRRTIGDWGCGGKLSRRRGHTPYPPSHIFKTLQ